MFFNFGKTYIGIGFIDPSELMLGQYLGTPSAEEPLKYIGIDMNPLCVARSQILYEMMKLDFSESSIFELWYLSCISAKT